MQNTTGRYRAGMPQLSFTGLSENWLLKECGHRHWEALAVHTGRATPDVSDDNGGRSYAAFTAIRLRAHGFDAVRENDEFDIHSALCRTGPVRHFSTHRIVRDDASIAEVSMSSTFVTRAEARNNRSVARATLAALAGAISPAPDEALAMTQTGKGLRAGDWASCEGLEPGVHEAARFLPCPNNDFNGADFLYFASFQSFVDRAEWQRHRFAEPPVIASRALHFYGNVNIGDALNVHVVGERESAQGIVHWSEVRRGSDNLKIADVVTEKRWRQR
ncbi:Pnap_2097 family protein [Paraburkholderia sp. 22099]|uniref:Pnap_2097 family protein n=1 Tax=Paraburkholderia sp. 22099 TaxID=3453875 RepID=UPI003F87B8BB